jgi:uncharacterized linocin/CFP29 family protein
MTTFETQIWVEDNPQQAAKELQNLRKEKETLRELLEEIVNGDSQLVCSSVCNQIVLTVNTQTYNKARELVDNGL